jgi:hypothetical protein
MAGIKRKKVIDTSNNFIYDSLKIASESTGINYKTLSNMLCGFNKNKTSLRYLDSF